MVGVLDLAHAVHLFFVSDTHRLEDLLTVGTTPLADDGSVELALDGYGYRWLRVVAADNRRLL